MCNEFMWIWFSQTLGRHNGTIIPNNMKSNFKMRVIFEFRFALETDFWFFKLCLFLYCRTILRKGFKLKRLSLPFFWYQTSIAIQLKKKKHWKLEYDFVVTQCHKETLKWFNYTDMFSESRAFSRYWKSKLMMATFTASKLSHRKMIPWHKPRWWHYSEAPGFLRLGRWKQRKTRNLFLIEW